MSHVYDRIDRAPDRPSANAVIDETDLADTPLEQPRGASLVCIACDYGGCRIDSAELSDTELDRPAHPNLACVTVSTGEFSSGRLLD